MRNDAAPKRRLCVVDPNCLEDLRFWTRQKPAIAAKALGMMEHVLRDPFTGVGKPEPLKGLPNIWSRRLTEEHRLVYMVAADRIAFLQARYHYK